MRLMSGMTPGLVPTAEVIEAALVNGSIVAIPNSFRTMHEAIGLKR